jgi:hypothetical protein
MGDRGETVMDDVPKVRGGEDQTPRDDRMYRLVAIFVLMFSQCLACAQQRPCSTVEAQRAETQETLRSWDVLYRSYKLFRACDDGAIAEGYSEAVARILVDHWSTLPRLVSLAKNDSEFRRFVLKHIDTTLDIDDIKKIKTNAKTRCPSELRTICTDLIKEADAALKEDASLGIE